MSNEKTTYTLEEMRVWQRNAFEAGVDWAVANSGRLKDPSTPRAATNEAAFRYPAPKKLREVDIDGYTYRVEDGRLVYRCGDRWMTSGRDIDAMRKMIDLADHSYED